MCSPYDSILSYMYFTELTHCVSLSVSLSQLGDVCYEDIPRVRLDRVRRPAKALWDGPPTLAEENEDSDTCLGNGMNGLNDIVLNTTLYNDLGKFLIFDDIKQIRVCS